MDYMNLFQKGFDNLRVCAGAGICQRDHFFASAHPPRQGELHPHMIKPLASSNVPSLI